MKKYFRKFYDEGANSGEGAPAPKAEENTKTEEVKTPTLNTVPLDIVQKLEENNKKEFERWKENARKDWETEYQQKLEKERLEKKQSELVGKIEKNEAIKKKFEIYGWDYKKLGVEELERHLTVFEGLQEGNTAGMEGDKIDTSTIDVEDAIRKAMAKEFGGK